ncbi:glycosyltransferase [Aminivibrio sp.]|jgi:glycosyltransferase involved in cell wall biosynthesis|uniref:glycosyltransferase n=1 Tax=Aminivibrio sp. TaxID=1872489 RepID=UPI003D99A15C
MPSEPIGTSKENFLFLGFAIPDEEIKKTYAEDKAPQVQTQKFVWNLIKGLTIVSDANLTFISARPVSDYPYYTKKFIKKTKWDVPIGPKQIQILEIPFINTSILKILTRFFSGLFYSVLCFHKKQYKKGVIVYSVHVPFMLIGFLISKIYGIELIGVWTDPPSVLTKRESRMKTALRCVEMGVSKWLMRRFSKVVVLTRHLAEDYAPGKPYLVIEGIVDENDAVNIETLTEKHNNQTTGQIKVVYTGALKEEYGIKNIVEAIRLSDSDNLVCDIYGSGNYEEELIGLSQIDSRIRFKGWVPNNVSLQAQRDADFLINARSADDSYVKYSFPSKTLEYMLSGTPLITTILPGMPAEYKDYVIELKDNSAKTICETLLKATSLDSNRRKEIGLKAVEFAKKKNYLAQAKNINIFLN